MNTRIAFLFDIPRKINYFENSYGNWKRASEKEKKDKMDRSLCFAPT